MEEIKNEEIKVATEEATEEEIQESEDSCLSDSEASESEIVEANEEELSQIAENKKETELDREEARETDNLRKVEAALFISGKWLDMQELVMLTDLNPILLRQLLEKLNERYSKDSSAVQIISKENLWKMDVREEHANMVNKLATGSSEFTKAEQETLAVIALKQPVKQSVIVKIRGNKAYDHVKKFRSLDLLKAKRAGHTWELNLSVDFYNYFHLQNSSGESLERNPVSENIDKKE